MKNNKLTYKEKYLIYKEKYNASLQANEDLIERLDYEVSKHAAYVTDLRLKEEQTRARDFIIFLVFIGCMCVIGCLGIILSACGLV